MRLSSGTAAMPAGLAARAVALVEQAAVPAALRPGNKKLVVERGASAPLLVAEAAAGLPLTSP